MIVYLIISFIIHKIVTQCYDKCLECTELGDDTNHKCTSCKYENNYLLETNCYYDYELPQCYLSSVDNQFHYCSENCYECKENEEKCMSCKRGYKYNSELYTCTICDSNKYIYVSDEVELCQGLENGRFACGLKYTICTDIDKSLENYECPREYPLFLVGTETKECALEKYESSTHIISNQIIKTQWLNNIAQIGVGQCWYITKSYSSNGDLILETSIYDGDDENINKNRYFHGINSNGRPLFYDSDNDQFINNKEMEAITNLEVYESQSIKINLVDDDKDYYLRCSFTETSIEITDFYNNKIIGISQYIFIGSFYWSTKIFDIIELINEPKVYLFCFIVISSPSYVLFQKYKFYKPDLNEENSYEKILSSLNTEYYTENSINYAATQSKIISCFEIPTYNLIQCLYVNKEKYFVLSLFKENDFQFVKSTLIDENQIVGHVDGSDWEYFFQNILIKNERTILSYVLDSTSNLVYIQIKNLEYNNGDYSFREHFSDNTKIAINSDGKYSLDTTFFLMELKKIDENRFCLILTGKNLYNLYILLFDFYNNDLGLYIRYYHIPFKLYDYRIYRFILSINFNGFLGLIYTVQNFWWIDALQYFSIFGYIRGIDSVLITMTSTTTLKLSDYINEENIENNLFGYIFQGVKILKLPQNIGIYYLSDKKKKLISDDDILEPDDIIIFVYDYTALILGSLYTIEVAGVVQEPSFTEFNKYPEYTEFYGTENPENYFTQRSLVGQTCFYNFTITNDLTGTNDGTCINNCKVCYDGYCVKCLENFHINEDLDICLPDYIDRYYYEESSRSYKPCFELCKTCSNGPVYDSNNNVENENCDTCIDNYYKVESTNNCVFCHENCKTCDGAKKNSTYYSCTSCDDEKILYDKSKNCLNCPSLGQYANYYQYRCIETIPDGYYLLDSVSNIIDKCYVTCKHCNIPGDSNNHKCTECSDAYPYSYNNGEKCLDDCGEENLYLESENKICYADCSTNTLNDKKYNYKNKCISLDDKPKNYVLGENNNFVSLCDAKKDYEFNNECYKSCPDGTMLDESNTERNMCICKGLYYLEDDEFYVCINSKSCPTDYPYLIIGSSQCTNCPVRYKGECFLECPEGTCITQINEHLATCVSSSNTNKVMNNNPGITVNIYPTQVDLETLKNNNENLTFIDLGECETKLREHYNIDPEQKFSVISVDVLTKISSQPTNDFNYEIYLDNGTEITDFSPCKNISIEISSPIINFDIINYEEAVIFEDQGYDIYDPTSSFYNDKCTAAYINGNDIIIKDRIKDIYPGNISYCPNNCELSKIELEAKRFNCSCNISSTDSDSELDDETELNVQTDESYIAYLLDMINYKLFGCYKIITNSTFNQYINNVGLYLGAIIILYNIATVFIFFLYYISIIRLEMFRQIPTSVKLFEKAKEIKNKQKKENKEKKEKKEKKGNKENNSENSLKNESIPSNPKSKKSSKGNEKLSTENDSKRKLMNTKNKKNFQNDKTKKNNKKKSKFVSEGNQFNNYNKLNNYVLPFKKNTYNKINEEIDVEKICVDKIILKDDEVDINEYNIIPYSQALRIDKRSIFCVFISLIKMKIDLISIIFYPEEYTHRTLLLSFYLLDFLFSYFMNALLYSDDVVSQKYHNNGSLDFATSLSLSLASNIISSITIWTIKKLTNYNEFLKLMVNDVYNEGSFIYLFHKIYRCLKIKISIYFILNFIVVLAITYYLFIFCIIYKKSQISLLSNYFLGIAESLLKSFGVAFVVCILRFISLKCKRKRIYRASVYLNELF